MFTLEKTNHLVPRWFSEGVSVYEEWTTGPLPGRHIPLTVFKAIKEDKFLAIAELDRGFIRPMYEAQVIVSYMQAGLTCEYIASRWGQQGLRSMLDQYAAGKDTPAALQAALAIEPKQFDKDFAGYVQSQLGGAVKNLEAWQKAAKEAQQAFLDKDWKSAVDGRDARDRASAPVCRREQPILDQGAREPRARRRAARDRDAARLPAARRPRPRARCSRSRRLSPRAIATTPRSACSRTC